MKVTKYPQSCLVVGKDDGGRILVDPGNFAIDAHDVDDFGPVDAVLYTHRHPDHCDERGLEALLERGATAYGNADVRALLGPGRVSELRDGEAVTIAGFEVLPRDLPHVPMIDGSSGPPNTGFVFDGTLFHPGDGIALDGLRVDALALPIAGPSISFRDAYRFVEEVGAKRAVPVHYDMFVADPHLFASRCDIAEVIVLGPGESADL
jgi:L-ascorbate metabolism protein UlaG (beta-lactamase superfamily)